MLKPAPIPFNKPYIIGRELRNIEQAVRREQLAGDGFFSHQCEKWLESRFGARKVLLTHSCTAALDMAAILCDIRPGDEFIVPSFTFTSTANPAYFTPKYRIFSAGFPKSFLFSSSATARAATLNCF